LIEHFIKSLFHFLASDKAPLLLKITFYEQHHMLINFLIYIGHFNSE